MAESQTFYAPSGNPIRCYTFDNVSGTTVYDEMGNGNGVIDSNKIAIVSGGRIGNCLSHTGTDGNYYKALSIADISTWRSLSAFVKFPVTGSKVYDFASTASGPILSRFADNTIRHRNGSTVLATVTDNNYHHYIITFDTGSDTHYSLYIDGVLITSRTDGYRGTMNCLGGYVNVSGYRSPDMDVIQVYDIHMNATDAAALYAMQELSALLFAYLEQQYDIEKTILFAISEQIYHLVPPIYQTLKQLYSILMEIWLQQIYGDVPEILATLSQPYRSAPVLTKSITQPWADALQLEAFIEQPWSMPRELGAFCDQRYGITAAVLLKTSEQLYHINANSTLLAGLSQPYALAGEVAAAYLFDTQLFIDGVRTPFVSGEWQSNEEYALSCEFTLKGIEIASRCIDGAEMVVTHAGESWYFICDGGWRQDKRYLSEVFRVSGYSKSKILDEAPPILGDIPGGLASQICSDLAAPFGISVDWQMADGYIADGKLAANNETPLAIIRKIVWDANGRIMSKQEGNLLIVADEETPIPDYASTTPAATIIARLERISTSEQTDKQPGYNKITVSDQLADGSQFSLEYQIIDSKSREIALFVTPIDDRDFYLVTSGGEDVSIEPFGAVELPVVDELVEFIAGAGKTKRPCYGITSMTWQRDNLGTVSFQEDGVLAATVAGDSLLKISYYSKYHKWIASDENIESIQFIAKER